MHRIFHKASCIVSSIFPVISRIVFFHLSKEISYSSAFYNMYLQFKSLLVEVYSKVISSSMTVLALAFAFLEFFHVFLHLRVLLMMSTYNTDDLNARTLYFVWDALSPWISLYCSGVPFVPYLYVLGLVHFLFHFIFLVQWGMPAEYVESIKRWSIARSWRSRVKVGWLDFVINTAGTSFDILTHTFIGFSILALTL